MDLGEVAPILVEVQKDIPLEQIAGMLDKAKSTLAERSRPLLPILLNSYILPQG